MKSRVSKLLAFTLSLGFFIGAGLATRDSEAQGFGSPAIVKSGRLNIVSKTTTYTAKTTEDIIFVDASGGAWSLGLPTAVGIKGKIYKIVRTDNNPNIAFTIDPNGAQTIDGTSVYQMFTQNEQVEIVSDNANWIILAHRCVTAWESYTPASITGLGTVSATSFYWRRVGDSIQVRGRLNSGTATATTLVISLPGAVSIATAKLPTPDQGVVLGHFFSNVDTTATALPATTRGPWVVTTKSGTTNGVMLTDTIDKDATATDTIFTAANANAFNTSGRALTVSFEVPIQGWNP